MKARRCSIKDLKDALKEVNKKYKGNITFNRFDFPTFTLKVKDSTKPGHRRGTTQYDYNTREMIKEGRRLISACWHVHGDFFDALFKVNPEAYIYSKGRRIDINQGNWQDENIGSQVFPSYYSEACDCYKEV